MQCSRLVSVLASPVALAPGAWWLLEDPVRLPKGEPAELKLHFGGHAELVVAELVVRLLPVRRFE